MAVCACKPIPVVCLLRLMASPPPQYPSRAQLSVDVNFEKSLPDAPALLTPQRKTRGTSPLPFFHPKRAALREQRLTFRKKSIQPLPVLGRMRWTFPFPALFIAVLVFILATFLLLYLAVFGRVPTPDHSAIYVSEPLTRTLLGLTLTTISTHAVSITVPFLLSVVAYSVAGKWVREQDEPNPTHVPLPTPLQYGLIAKMLTKANIPSAMQAGQYLRLARGRIRVPRAFYLALGYTSLILGLSLALILVDVWIHAAVSVDFPISRDRGASFTIAFNESACSGSCLNDTATQSKGLRIASNSSEDLAIVTLSDASDLAVVVPQTVQNTDLETPSFGVLAQCENLTPICAPATRSSACPFAVNPSLAQGGGLSSASASMSRSGSARTSRTSNAVLPTPTASLSSGTTILATSGSGANPQHVVVRLRWPDADNWVPLSGVASNVDGDVFSWAACALTFSNVTLQRLRGEYSVAAEPTLVEPAFASVMQGPLLWQFGNLQLSANLQATMLSAPDETSAIAALNQGLARLSLALFSGTLQVIEPAIQRTPSPGPQPALGRYPIAPLTIYLFLLFTYALTALFVYISAARLQAPIIRSPGRPAANAAQLTQLRLTDPLAHVAALYPSPGHAVAPEDVRELFLESEDPDAPRLEAGVRAPAPGVQPAFGVYRRPGPWSGIESG
ncbi:hypothetical protein MKEN_01037900 [Mycena kentingensis (nom. inval.)]|nr:hypothetical protein MKEN_01037900 [Mycena kentingensis (nom. inval.)]